MSGRFRWTLQRKFLAWLLPLLGLLLVVLMGMSYRQQMQATRRHSEAELAGFMQMFEHLRDTHMQTARTIAILASRFEFLQEAYRAKDPEAGAQVIKGRLDPIIRSITNDPARFQLHFHRPPARSFYRSWTSKRGDDLRKFRGTLLEIERTQRPLVGTELGVGGFAFRGIAPIQGEGGTYVGSCEFFYAPEDILALLQVKGRKVAFLTTVDAAKAESLFSKDALAKSFPTRAGSILVAPPSAEWLVAERVLSKGNLHWLESATSPQIRSEGTLTLGLLPVVDFSGQRVGSILFVADDGDRQAKAIWNVGWIMMTALFGGTLFALTLRLVFKRLVVGPLRRAQSAAEAIAIGDLDQAIQALRGDK